MSISLTESIFQGDTVRKWRCKITRNHDDHHYSAEKNMKLEQIVRWLVREPAILINSNILATFQVIFTMCTSYGEYASIIWLSGLCVVVLFACRFKGYWENCIEFHILLLDLRVCLIVYITLFYSPGTVLYNVHQVHVLVCRARVVPLCTPVPVANPGIIYSQMLI